jgi:adenylylsulfate kinase-like enzyme
VLIVISGPIASGKSTVARSLAQEFERAGMTAAAIDVDVVYDMLEHKTARKLDGAKWAHARHGAAVLANGLMTDGIEVVIVEGDFLTPKDRASFLGEVHPTKPRFVTLRVSFETALRRAHNDPTRGLSRDRAFLWRHYEEASAALRDVPTTDLVLETESVTVAETVRAIASWVYPASPHP